MRGLKNVDIAQQNESYIDDAENVAAAMSGLIGYKAPDDGLQGKMVVLGSESGAQQQKAESYVDKLKPKEKVKEGSCWCR